MDAFLVFFIGPCLAAILWRRVGTSAGLITLMLLAIDSVGVIDRAWTAFFARGYYSVATGPTSDKLAAVTYFAVIALVLGELQGRRNPEWAEGLAAALLGSIAVALAWVIWPDTAMPTVLVVAIVLTIVRLPVTARRAARQN